MTTLTEGARDLEFLLSEAAGNRSRENGTLVTGQNLAAGSVLMFDVAKKLTLFVGTEGTDGDPDVAAAGVLCYATDASSEDKAVSYIARDAEVIEAELTYGPETTDGEERTSMIQSLRALGIIVRSENEVEGPLG